MKTIGGYVVRGLLGRGGMGRVYKVHSPGSDVMMALKLLDPRPELTMLLGPEQVRRLFVAEARVMQSISHPHICPALDFVDGDDVTFVLMDYYCLDLGEVIGEGYDLEAPSRRLDADRATDYILQALSGLNALHEADIVHRDVKPFNLLLDKDDTVKVTDFGLSRLRGESFTATRRLHVGTPYYTAPEQEADPDSAGPEADVFSAGVLLHRLLTGRLPGGVPASALNQDLDVEWDALLARCLARRPGDRYSSAGEMAGALEEVRRRRRGRLSDYCRLEPPVTAGGRMPTPLRSRPTKTAPRDAQSAFGLDELDRPRVYAAHDFIEGPEDTVVDRAAGLMWEKSGSDQGMTWQDAGRRAEELSRKRLAGCDDWRLPTVDELLSSLSPPARGGDYCLPPVFDRGKHCLWSADRRSVLAAWYVNTDVGAVGRQDHTCRFFMRAVRTAA